MFTGWLKGMLVGVTVALGDTVSVEAREAVEEEEAEMEMEAELEKEGEGELDTVEVGVWVTLWEGVAEGLAVPRVDPLDVPDAVPVREGVEVEVEVLEDRLVREGDPVVESRVDGVAQLADGWVEPLRVVLRVPVRLGVRVYVTDTLNVTDTVELVVVEVDWEGDRVTEGDPLSEELPLGLSEDDPDSESWPRTQRGGKNTRIKNTSSIAAALYDKHRSQGGNQKEQGSKRSKLEPCTLPVLQEAQTVAITLTFLRIKCPSFSSCLRRGPPLAPLVAS
jgi:hypothetical protein